MAAPKPTVFPEFALLDLNNGTAGAPNVVEPSSGKKDTGWNEGERPPRETFNWLARITNEWIEYFECVVEGAGAGVQFGQDVSTTTGLTFGFLSGIAQVKGQDQQVAAGTLLLTDDQVTDIYYNSDTNAIQQFLGPASILPPHQWQLFEVTTAGGVITVVNDLRTWATGPSITSSFTDEDEVISAGRRWDEAGDYAATDATPSVDCRDGNVFIHHPNATPGSIVWQTPSFPPAAGESQELTLITVLDNNTQSLSFSAAYIFTDILDDNGLQTNFFETDDSRLTWVVKAVYDPVDTDWKCTIVGGRYGHDMGRKVELYKTADETKSVTGVVNDNHMNGFQLKAGKTYRVTGFLTWDEDSSGGANDGIDLNWSVDSGTIEVNTDKIYVTSWRTGTGSPDTNEFGVFFPSNVGDLTLTAGGGFNDQTFAEIRGFITVTTDVQLSLQWAPASAFSLTMGKGSHIIFEELFRNPGI